ncbi:FtsX-like permease family protein [Actinoplanes subglobosus]|uniref:FtsX-like permease family protein n=1 Tax=Actinoplanes subglobosus TaxID=1547892 RepID=A0ABV8J5Q0_9ACTN
MLAGDPALIGRTIRLRTPAGIGDYRVAGVLAPVSFERAVFFTDGMAATISPRIDNLVVDAAPEDVRALVSAFPGVQVLTGDDRRRADPDPDRDRNALVAMNALLGTAGGVTTFVSVFVVASTFAFAVAQRRREIGLLRMAGATPRQVRRTVFAEAAVVGVVASAAGCLLGSCGAPMLARLLVDERLAPPWFAIGDQRWPYHVAFWTGLIVAMAGVVTATVRAGRIRPSEALREASVDVRAMTALRWIFGVGILAAGLGLLCWRLLTDPGEALHRKTYTTQPMLLITAVALLAPVLAGPLARLVAWLPARLPGATGMLIQENASAARRRTAAVAAPILITVALAGSLLGTTATITAAEATELRTRTIADLIITGDPGDRTVAAIRAVPGAQVMPSASTAVYTMEDGVALTRSGARAVDPSALESVRRLPVAAGRVADLDDDGIIVNEEWAVHTVGDRVDVWLGDGTPRSLRVVAVLATGTGGNGVYVTTRNAGGAPTDLVELSWRPGTDSHAAEAAVRRLLTRSSEPEPGDGAPTARNLLTPAHQPKLGATTGLAEPSGQPEHSVAHSPAGPVPQPAYSVTHSPASPVPQPEHSVTHSPASPVPQPAYSVTHSPASPVPQPEHSVTHSPASPDPQPESSLGNTTTHHPAGPTPPPESHVSGALAGDLAAGSEVRVQGRDEWLAGQLLGSNRQTRVGFLVVLGIALLYTGIAVANTMVMATSDRGRELAVLRLAGATKRQVVLLVAAEALTVVMVGAVLGLVVTVLNLLGVWAALAALSVWTAVVVPWSSLAMTLLACAVVAVVAAVLPTVSALRTHPVELAGTRD